jgi:fumarate reductase subunit C
MTARKPYIRSMQGWWLKDPFYRKYMVREATAVFVGIYAIVLLEGLMALASGEAAWNAWLMSLRSPLSIIFHLIALAAAVYHTVTWFAVSPKLAPILIIGKQRVPPVAVTAIQYVIAVVLYILLLWLAVSA